VTSLLMKTLENATREYARECVKKCGMIYGFDVDDAVSRLNLENLSLQVREMKKRSTGKKTKEPKEPKEVKTKIVKEKAVKEVKEKPYKVPFALPFVEALVNSDGCHGLAFNGGLFTQCQKIRMSQSKYCKGCQMEADGSASGSPSNGTVEERCSEGLMEFRDSKGRKPIAYTKIMEKQNLTREQVEAEAGKLNIEINEIHFAVVETKKAEAGRPKASKKKTVTVEDESIAVEDLFAQLVEEESEDESATVLMSDSDNESVVDTKDLEKAERNLMKEADSESKKVEKAMKSAENKALKEQKLADEKAAKEQKLADEKAAKEQKLADEKAAKEQKIADELAAKEAKKQQLEADKIAKAEKIAADKLAKEEKIAADKLAKEEKIAAEKAAKEQKIADELAAKEAKKQQLEADKIAKEQKKAEELAAKEAKKTEVKKVEKKVETKKPEAKAAASVAASAATKKAEVAAEEPAKVEEKKKVTVKRITIDGKQYLKTSENLLYDPVTKEEMGIYDPETNTIKELPEDSDDEVSEDGYESE